MFPTRRLHVFAVLGYSIFLCAAKFDIILSMRNIILSILFLCVCAGCRRTDVRDFTIHVPGMTQSDEAAVKGALAMYAGVDKASYVFDYSACTLSLKYDSMQVAKKNLELAIAKAGFTANGVTPESVGASPQKK